MAYRNVDWKEALDLMAKHRLSTLEQAWQWIQEEARAEDLATTRQLSPRNEWQGNSLQTRSYQLEFPDLPRPRRESPPQAVPTKTLTTSSRRKSYRAETEKTQSVKQREIQKEEKVINENEKEKVSESAREEKETNPILTKENPQTLRAWPKKRQMDHKADRPHRWTRGNQRSQEMERWDWKTADRKCRHWPTTKTSKTIAIWK